jgi:plasmid rolling circle replication initiator protein Rep
MDYVQSEYDYKFIFVTFTQKNVKGEELSEEIDRIFAALKRLDVRKRFAAINKGYFRSLEVTHNWETDEYHPHVHMVVAVNKSYFTDKTYISHDDWVDLWRSCMRLLYPPNVDVQRVRGFNSSSTVSVKKAIAEIAKYSAKSADYLHKSDKHRTDNAVAIFDSALANRRLFAFGGKFREIHKNLNLDDPTDGGLTDEEIRPDLTYIIVKYNWHGGKYIKFSEES